MTPESVNQLMDGIRKLLLDALAEDRRIDIDMRGGMVEVEPVNNCVTRKPTGEKTIQIFVGPSRWKAA